MSYQTKGAISKKIILDFAANKIVNMDHKDVETAELFKLLEVSAMERRAGGTKEG